MSHREVRGAVRKRSSSHSVPIFWDIRKTRVSSVAHARLRNVLILDGDSTVIDSAQPHNGFSKFHLPVPGHAGYPHDFPGVDFKVHVIDDGSLPLISHSKVFNA